VAFLPDDASLSASCESQQGVAEAMGPGTVRVSLPDILRSGGEAACVLDVDSVTLPFTFKYLDVELPFVASLYPEGGVSLGGTRVTLYIRHLPAGLTVDNFDVSVADSAALAQAYTVTATTGEKESGRLEIVTPAIVGFGSRELNVVFDGNTSHALHALFAYFQPCDFDTFCPTVGQVTNWPLVRASPPTSSYCSVVKVITYKSTQ
jgi:hypothetical protein